MENTQINKKILIGVGCSHVQGCAAIEDRSIGDNLKPQLTSGFKSYTMETHNFGSPELKQHYGKDKVSAEWITENVSWIGHLGNLLEVDEKLNFGAGGRGIECNIRTLKNYAFRNPDLSNHYIFWMLPSFLRFELLRKKDNDWGYTQLVTTLDSVMSRETIEYKKNLSVYVENFHHPEPIRYNHLLEVYFTQEYLKKLGAKVFIFDYFNSDLDELNERNYDEDFIQRMMESNAAHYHYYKAPYIPIADLLEGLELIPQDLFGDDNVLKKVNTKYECINMEGAKLRKDSHMAPDGNKWLAEMLFYCFKNNLVGWKYKNKPLRRQMRKPK